MNITILPSDGTIVLDGRAFTELDFSSQGITIPDNIHALHWRGDDEEGIIEYTTVGMSNEVILSLPDWVTECQTYHGELAYAEDNPDPIVLSEDEKLAIVKDQRDNLLEQTDWIFVSDSPISESDQALWSTYRQSLRDLTSQSGFYWDGIYNYTNWPQPPFSNIIYEPELDSNLFDRFTQP